MGATIYAISRSPGPLEELKKLCPKVKTATVNLENWNETRSVLTRFLNDVKIDGLVNNAGVGIGKPFEESSEKDFDEYVSQKALEFNLMIANNKRFLPVFPFNSTVNVNLKGVFNVTQILIPNINDGGSIVNVSSLAGLSAFADHSVYSITKAGLDGLTRALALEYGKRRIRVNSVNPTVVWTKMSIKHWSGARGDELKSKIPLNRFAEVREVVDPIIFLLSEQSSFINGHSVPIEGGYSAC